MIGVATAECPPSREIRLFLIVRGRPITTLVNALNPHPFSIGQVSKVAYAEF